MRPAGSGGWWQQHGSLVSNGGIASEGTLLEQHGEWVSDDFDSLSWFWMSVRLPADRTF